MKERSQKETKLSSKEQKVRRTLNKRTKSPRLTRFIADIIFDK